MAGDSNDSYYSRKSTSDSAVENGALPEGQLRYWTAEMCTNSPHLFDYVVTVCAIVLLVNFRGRI